MNATLSYFHKYLSHCEKGSILCATMAFVLLENSSCWGAENAHLSQKLQPNTFIKTEAATVAEEIVVVAPQGTDDLESGAINQSGILATGATTIGELLSRVRPYMNLGEEEPLVLVNGRPIGFDQSILSYPVEALERAGVLKADSNSRYGADPSRTVVNLVLKKQFSSNSLDIGVGGPTSGGQNDINLGVMRVVISGDTRWSIQTKGAVSTKIVKKTGVAAIIGSENHTNTALAYHDAFETVLPSTQNASLGGAITRPVGPFNATLNFETSRRKNFASRGIPVDFDVPSHIPSSHPDAMNWPSAAMALLKTGGIQKKSSVALTINGIINSIQSNISAIYSIERASNISYTKCDKCGETSEIVSETGEEHDTCYSCFAKNRDSVRSEALNFALNLQDDLFPLPAGFVIWSFTGNAAATNSVINKAINEAFLSDVHRRTGQINGMVALNIPVSRVGSNFGTLGSLSINVNIGSSKFPNSRAQLAIGSGFSWGPFSRIQFSGALSNSTVSTSRIAETVAATNSTRFTFDYDNLEVVGVDWITGGSLPYRQGSQKNTMLSVRAQPFRGKALELGVIYKSALSSGLFVAFPEISPKLEMLFPERFIRNDAGRLVSVDARPVEVKDQRKSSLAVSMSWSSPIGVHNNVSSEDLNQSDQTQISAALSYDLRIMDRVDFGKGGLAFNRLNADGATSRDDIAMNIDVGGSVFGGSVSAYWSRPISYSSDEGLFRITPPIMLDLSLFFNPWRGDDRSSSRIWLKGLNINFSLQNILDARQRISLSSGGTRTLFKETDVDPIGRRIRIAVRKRF